MHVHECTPFHGSGGNAAQGMHNTTLCASAGILLSALTLGEAEQAAERGQLA